MLTNISGAMADIFLSFATHDTERVQLIYDALIARGLAVFWSNEIPKGAPNYQKVIETELRKARIVVVVWTHGSGESGPVAQECSQAQLDNKLIQVVLDGGILPIKFPMEASFKAQKTMLVDWNGDIRHSEWMRLNASTNARLRSVDTSIEGLERTLRSLRAIEKRQRRAGLYPDDEKKPSIDLDYAYRRVMSVLARLPDGVTLKDRVSIQNDLGRQVMVGTALTVGVRYLHDPFNDDHWDIVEKAFKRFRT